MDGLIKNIIVPKRSPSPGPVIELEIEFKNDKNATLKFIGYEIKFKLNNILIDDRFKLHSQRVELREKIKFKEDFLLNHFLFWEIEKARNWKEVLAEVEIQTISINERGEFGPGSFLPEYVYFNQPYKISESKWAEMASALGHRNYAIFEIPIPKALEIDDFKLSIKRLHEAQELFYEGKNEEVVTKCRKAFESVNTILAKKVSKDTYVMEEKLASQIDLLCPGKAGKPKKSERIEEIRQGIFTLLHIGPHEGYNVTREDAEYILFLSLSMFRYYSTQLEKISHSL